MHGVAARFETPDDRSIAPPGTEGEGAHRRGLRRQRLGIGIIDPVVGLEQYDRAVLNYQTYLDREPYADDADEVNQRLLEAEKLVGQ